MFAFPLMELHTECSRFKNIMSFAMCALLSFQLHDFPFAGLDGHSTERCSIYPHFSQVHDERHSRWRSFQIRSIDDISNLNID